MIEVKSFKKTFYVGLRRKPAYAARNITFEVEPGEIFGFLGPNGSGKTTTIKALLGLIKPDSGVLRILGHESTSMQWRAQVGYMPEHPTFYDFLTGFEMVAWFGRLSGLARAEAEKEAKVLLERVGLGHAMKRRLRGYSKGMLQRAGLAQAMIGSPKLLILDEPMTGLDPIGRRDIRELIVSLKHEGKTIFYSTHILPDVEMTCDRVSIIHSGETKRTGRLQDILTETTRGVEVVFSNISEDELTKIQESHPNAKLVDGQLAIDFEDETKAWEYAQAVLNSGAKMVRFQPHRDDLESIFMRSLGSTAQSEEHA